MSLSKTEIFSLDNDYDYEILKYFLKSGQIKIETTFFHSIINQKISKNNLEKLLIWMIKTCEGYQLNFLIIQASILYIYYYLSSYDIDIDNLHLLGVVSIFVALKNYKNSYYITIEAILYLADNKYSVDELFSMEIKLIKAIKWKLSIPLPGELIRLLLNISVVNISSEILEEIDDMIQYCLTTIEFLVYPIQIIAVSSLFCCLERKGSQPVIYYIQKVLHALDFDMETLTEFYCTLSSIMDTTKFSSCDNEEIPRKDFENNYESPKIKKKEKYCESTSIPIEYSEKTKMEKFFNSSSKCPEPFQNFEEEEFVKKEKAINNSEKGLDEKDIANIFKF